MDYNEQFDIIYMCGVLHYVLPKNYEQGIKNIAKALKK
jgi:cyclopropane fatty-acyl-phospholipid synthase-like methyltransferase